LEIIKALSLNMTKIVLMLEHKKVLVAIINNRRDLKIAQEKHWYRIPVKSAPKRWKSDYLAFYQTKVFGKEKWAINYYAEIKGFEKLKRIELLPGEKNHPRALEDYYKIEISELKSLPKPIISRRWRRITFICTSLSRLKKAEEINDLFMESPLEEKVWYELKRKKIEAERQYLIGEGKVRYYLDFAIFCQKGKIDVECNGDFWHSQKRQIFKDNQRDNFLTSQGWSVLRFGSKEINKSLQACLELIKKIVNGKGGIQNQKSIRKFLGNEAIEQLELL
jgi:very-short-patch-repair endonuclease